MDYFQGVVTQYLRAMRFVFQNPEFLLQLDRHPTNPEKGKHWYVDILATSFSDQTVYLCEVSYSKTLSALATRLTRWSTHWDGIHDALQRDAKIPDHWHVRPWVFIPEIYIPALLAKTGHLTFDAPGQRIKATTMEMTLPWKFRTWNMVNEASKEGMGIPNDMW